MFVQMLQELNDNEFYMMQFREALQRTIDNINPVITMFNKFMENNLLEKLIMECQLLSTNSYLYLSDEKIENMKRLLETIESNQTDSNKKIKQMEEEEEGEDKIEIKINNGIPIREIRIGTYEIQRAWMKQFLLSVDSNNKTMNITLFKYIPDPIDDELSETTVKQGPSKLLGKHIRTQFEKYEISRMLLTKIPLDSITAIHFFKSEKEGNKEFALFAIEVDKPPHFYSKRINSSSDLLNNWRLRSDFTNKSEASTYTRFYFSGEFNDFEVIVSLLIAIDSRFKTLVQTGIIDIGDDTIKHDSNITQLHTNTIVDTINSNKQNTKEIKKIPLSVYRSSSSNINNSNNEDNINNYHSDVDSETDVPHWPGWKHYRKGTENSDSDQNEDEENYDDDDDDENPFSNKNQFFQAFAEAMNMQDNLNDDDDEEEEEDDEYYDEEEDDEYYDEDEEGAVPPFMEEMLIKQMLKQGINPFVDMEDEDEYDDNDDDDEEEEEDEDEEFDENDIPDLEPDNDDNNSNTTHSHSHSHAHGHSHSHSHSHRHSRGGRRQNPDVPPCAQQ